MRHPVVKRDTACLPSCVSSVGKGGADMDVVTMGEAMAVFYPRAAEPIQHARTFEKSLGGAESNLAVALARLGHSSAWIGRLGHDGFGHFIHNFLRGEGVDTSGVVFDTVRPTAVYFKERRAGQETRVFYYRTGSAGSGLGPDDVPEALVAGARYLHLTGITLALSESCRTAVHRAAQIARGSGVKVVFDPNIRPKLWSEQEARSAIMELMGLVDVALPGLSEGQLLTGEAHPEGIAGSLHARGVSTVVVKLGAEGAFFSGDGGSGYTAAVPVERVVDPVGAGDAFDAGFLAGRLRGYGIHGAVELGHRVASRVLCFEGDIEGLPTWEEAVQGD